MLENIRKGIFSLSGLSIGLGVLGFLSGLAQLFIDIDDKISVKWLLFTLLIGLSLVFILLKIIFDLHLLKNAQSNHESPIKFLEKEGILVIKKNEHFVNTIIVGCYYLNDEVERLAYVGVVHHIQDRVIQIRIIRCFLHAKDGKSPLLNINHLIIRPVVPYSALEHLVSWEVTND